VLRNNSFWALWGLSVLIGACATAATIFVFLNAGWQYETITHDSFMQFFFDVMPLFWLVSFGLMVLFGYYNVRHTARGYRFSFYLVVLASVVASFIGGTILYTLGVGKDIDNFRRPLPFSPPIMTLEETRWNDISRGLLSGIVKSFDATNQSVTLTLFSDQDKVLSTRELSDRDVAFLVSGAHIRIIGGLDKDDIDTFVACVVVPWDKPVAPNHFSGTYTPPVFSGERKEDAERIKICKDVRPYRRYQETVITN
jgi:hypothetical protein